MKTSVTAAQARIRAAWHAGAPSLRAWRGLHEGASIVVCGCGPSLRELSVRERLVTIGVNDVGRLFDPTYLVVVNPRNQFREDRFRYVETSNASALFTQLDLGRVRPRIVKFRLGRYGGVDIEGDALHYTQNSPYVAACLAAHMGARRIGLIGVDFTDDHFFARTGRHPLAGRLREIDAQYGRLAAALGRRGVELVNLSSISRLTSLPRMRIDDAGAWQRTESGIVSPEPRTSTMRVSIDKYAPGIIADLLDRLAATARQLGYEVTRQARCSGHDRHALAIVWNGRNHCGHGPRLYCEHGWLPRSAYQISPRGINADSHLAPFVWDRIALSAAASAALDSHIAAIKAASFSGYYQYMEAGKEQVALPPQFLLVPLQIELDTNIVRHAPAWLRSMQALIDYVTRVDPPWPVIFKQHPADARRNNQQLRLRTRRRQDRIWAHSQGNIHQMLKSPACRGILTLNSNVAHDGLLWDVPAIVLGRNVWPAAGDVKPFLTAVPSDWSQLAASATDPMAVACRRAYAHYLMVNQWTLTDACDATRVEALLKSAKAVAPEPSVQRRWRMTPSNALESMPGRTLSSVPRAQAGRERPLINVVAENRGWLFEVWKRRYAQVRRSDLRIVATDRPMRNADAWIFVRAREAGRTPDPTRTLVQIHDLADAGLYQRSAERSAVRDCAALSFTHPRQRDILQANSIDVASRQSIVRPVGWSSIDAVAPSTCERASAARAPSIAWIGRPAPCKRGDGSQLRTFLDAAAVLPMRPHTALIGERLEKSAAELRSVGIDCRAYDSKRFPIARCAEWIGHFDCVIVTGETDAGPWPLFDALHAGVPVVATRVGWASELLADGTCGRLVDDSSAMSAAIEGILAQRERWRAQRAQIAARVIDYSLSNWVGANVELALSLARPAMRRVA